MTSCGSWTEQPKQQKSTSNNVDCYVWWVLGILGKKPVLRMLLYHTARALTSVLSFFPCNQQDGFCRGDMGALSRRRLVGDMLDKTRYSHCFPSNDHVRQATW